MTNFLPQKRCLSTLADTRAGVFYSASARKKLWNGRSVSPVLEFDRVRFGQIRRENADRISISGIQDKISLRLDKNRLVPTTEDGEFILKPIPGLEGIDQLEDVPANEHVTMQIAARVFRLPTAVNGLVFFQDGAPAYIVRRFDRHSQTGEKLHQEDFCQLSGRSSDTGGVNYKYDSSYEEIGELLYRFCPAARVEALKLFRLVAFDYLIGNGDAHLKNFSLLEGPDGDMLLSPAYDLLNTNVHFPNESRTALEFFRDFETPQFGANGFYSSSDFRELGSRFKLPTKQIEGMLAEFRRSFPAIEELVKRSFLSEMAQHKYLNVAADRLKALEI
jgi:serine/threonine-protein kinase HipA